MIGVECSRNDLLNTLDLRNIQYELLPEIIILLVDFIICKSCGKDHAIWDCLKCNKEKLTAVQFSASPSFTACWECVWDTFPKLLLKRKGKFDKYQELDFNCIHDRPYVAVLDMYDFLSKQIKFVGMCVDCAFNVGVQSCFVCDSMCGSWDSENCVWRRNENLWDIF